MIDAIRIKTFVLALIILIGQNSYNQTVGVTHFDDAALDGLTFFSPFSGTRAYLVDNCGRLVNSWDRGSRPGLAAYFLDNGLMLRTFKPAPLGPFTSASNAGGLELVDWDNNAVWSLMWNSPTEISHHDAVYLPSGNILLLTWELVYRDELIAMGRDPGEIAPQGFMWSEKIVEIQPVGQNDAQIIWQWEIRDHYIQDFDSTKLNFGIVGDHPELFDINLPDINSTHTNGSRDWNHFNAIDYNPELDQILLSVRNSGEIWILDHSTTTEEAKTHEGGRYGKGGDILYRWGNPNAYRRGNVSDQQLFGQHGVQWIQGDLEGAGQIIVFNNGNGRPGPDYSTVEIIDPPQSIPGHYIIDNILPFGPVEAEIIYGEGDDETFYSAFLSNAQRLQNGHTLVNAGSLGEIFEITPNRNIVWKYVIPLFGDFPATQGQTVNNNANFRAYKYPRDYPGFAGLDLTPEGTIENGVNPLGCPLVISSSDEAHTHQPKISFQPGMRMVRVEHMECPCLARLYDSMGSWVLEKRIEGNTWTLPQMDIPQEVYYLVIRNRNGEVQSTAITMF